MTEKPKTAYLRPDHPYKNKYREWNIAYIRKDLVDEILEENLILQKQVNRLEEDLIKKTVKGGDHINVE